MLVVLMCIIGTGCAVPKTSHQSMVPTNHIAGVVEFVGKSQDPVHTRITSFTITEVSGRRSATGRVGVLVDAHTTVIIGEIKPGASVEVIHAPGILAGNPPVVQALTVTLLIDVQPAP